MKRKIQFIIAGSIIAAVLVGILYQGTQSTVFFYTPGEILAEPEQFQGKVVRIGALVEKGSTQWNAEAVELSFRVTEDAKVFIPVVFDGVKPDLYREGQGVVVEGRLDGGGVFRAHTLLVKHSEEYSVEENSIAEKEAIYRSLSKQ